MRSLIACILLLFFVTPAFAEPVPPVVVPVVAPVFDAAVADRMVVRITNLKGEFRATGFYIGNNIVVTANHVTENQNRARTPFGYVEMPPTQIKHLLVWNKMGGVSLATVTYKDAVQDVATLTLESDIGLMAVTFGEAPKRGDDLFMISHPLGITWSLSRGYLARTTITMEDGQIRGLASLLATGGSSGGPVFNQRGEVVGVAVQVFTSGAGVLFVPNSVFKEKVAG